MKKRLLSILFSFIFILLNSGCSCSEEEIVRGEEYASVIVAYLDKEKTETSLEYPFNTTISFTYFKESDKERAKQYFDEEMTYLHMLFDRHYYYYRDNELVNNVRIINESDEPVVVDDHLINIIKEGIRFTKLSKGKFNIGVGNLSSLWDDFISLGNSSVINSYIRVNDLYIYEEGNYSLNSHGNYININGVYVDISNLNKYSLVNNEYIRDDNGNYVLLKNIEPSVSQISESMACTPTYTNIDQVININEANKTVKINTLENCNSRVTLTLGALAKSYAVDYVANSEEMKNGDFLINAGQSTIKIIGKNLLRENGTWNVGVTDSYLTYKGLDNNYPSYVMKLDNEYGVSTSSGDENHYISNGHYYHHIIDPLTGYPNENRLAVTAIGSSAMYMDIITTSVMSMTTEETRTFLNDLRSEGIIVELFIQDIENNNLNLLATENMKQLISVREDESKRDYLNALVIGEL